MVRYAGMNKGRTVCIWPEYEMRESPQNSAKNRSVAKTPSKIPRCTRAGVREVSQNDAIVSPETVAVIFCNAPI